MSKELMGGLRTMSHQRVSTKREIRLEYNLAIKKKDVLIQAIT